MTGTTVIIAPRNIKIITPGIMKFLVYRRTAEITTNKRLRPRRRVTSGTLSSMRCMF